MPRHFKNTLFILTIVTVLLFVTIIISRSADSKIHFIYDTFSMPFEPLQKASSNLTSEIKGSLSVLSSIDEVKEELQSVKNENDELKNKVNEAQSVIKQNEELRELLGLKEQYTDYQYIAASIIAGDATDWSNVFQIDKGTADGIVIHSSVITSKGLVGIVVSCGLTSSKIMTVVDETNILMARIARTNDLVRVRGISNENMVFELRVDRIASNVDIFVGDRIITAESGGVYPKGLVIGTVKSIQSQSSDSTRVAIIEPAVDFKRLSEVIILSPKETQGDK